MDDREKFEQLREEWREEKRKEWGMIRGGMPLQAAHFLSRAEEERLVKAEQAGALRRTGPYRRSFLLLGVRTYGNGLPYKLEIKPRQTSREIFGADGT